MADNHEPKHPPADMAGLDGLIERLRAIPVWMVEAMTPGWQTHGTAAYEAATQLQALADRIERLEAALLMIAIPRVGGGQWASEIARKVMGIGNDA